MKKSNRHNKQLTTQDLEIWHKITNTAQPLHASKKNIFTAFFENDAGTNPNLFNSGSLNKLHNTTMPVYQAPAPIKLKPVATAMDYEMSKKIRKGKIPIEGRVDLHGLTQKEAWRALYERIENAYYTGEKVILVITGKGNMGRGILREQVPLWLSSASFRLLISEYGTSHISHGGTGALYVRIRRRPAN